MIHLHLHTEYSIGDSIIRIPALADVVKAKGDRAVAITDHASVGGWLEAIVAFKDAGIKPLLGVEMYVVEDMHKVDKDEKRYHVVLLACDKSGWRNIIKLVNLAVIDGFYYVPRVDVKTILENADGIIMMSACVKSFINMPSVDLKKIRDVMPLYLEVMLHDIAEQRELNLCIERLWRDGYSVVVTTDTHYYTKDDKIIHNVLLKMQDREEYSGNTYYYYTEQDVYELYRLYHPYLDKEMVVNGIDNIEGVVEAVGDYDFVFSGFKYPEWKEVYDADSNA